MPPEISIQVNPTITSAQLYEFYRRNNICEANYTEQRAAEVLKHPSLIVAAFEGNDLVGIVRALSDGLAAAIMEFSVDLRFQGGAPRYQNGSLVEADESGLGRQLGMRLLHELAEQKVELVTGYVVEACEEAFYASLGFEPNEGHKVYYIDRRPYARQSS